MTDNSGGLAGGLSGGLKMAAVALLVQQLMKHAQAEHGTAPAGQRQALPGTGTATQAGRGQDSGSQGAGNQDMSGQGAGGLGGILGGLFGGGSSGGLLGGLGGGALGGLLSGLAGMLTGARRHGLADHVESWVGPGSNQVPSAQQLEPMFDPAAVDAAARHAGTDRGTLLEAVAQVMPGMVDRLTPQGRLPQPGEPMDPALAGELRGMLGAAGPERGA